MFPTAKLTSQNMCVEDIIVEDTFYSVLADLDIQPYLAKEKQLRERYRGQVCCFSAEDMASGDPPET